MLNLSLFRLAYESIIFLISFFASECAWLFDLFRFVRFIWYLFSDMWNIEHYLFVLLSIWLLYFRYFMPDQRSHWLICSSIKMKKEKKNYERLNYSFSASWHDLYLYILLNQYFTFFFFFLISNVQCSVFNDHWCPMPLLFELNWNSKFLNNKNCSVCNEYHIKLNETETTTTKPTRNDGDLHCGDVYQQNHSELKYTCEMYVDRNRKMK